MCRATCDCRRAGGLSLAPQHRRYGRGRDQSGMAGPAACTAGHLSDSPRYRAAWPYCTRARHGQQHRISRASRIPCGDHSATLPPPRLRPHRGTDRCPPLSDGRVAVGVCSRLRTHPRDAPQTIGARRRALRAPHRFEPAPGRALLTIGLTSVGGGRIQLAAATAADFSCGPTMRAGMWSLAPAHPPVGPPCSPRAKWLRRLHRLQGRFSTAR